MPATAAAAVTAPAWAVPAAAGAALFGFYKAIEPERSEYDEDKCRKILEEIYRYMGVLNGRINDMLADQNRLYDFAYDKPLSVGPLAGKGTWTGHFQQATGWQNGLPASQRWVNVSE